MMSRVMTGPLAYQQKADTADGKIRVSEGESVHVA